MTAVPSPALRRDMLRQMLRIRRVEEEIVNHYPDQEMRCPTHICIGQEAPPVGVSAHLNFTDWVFSAHRSHGHYLAKGGDLRAMIAEIYGRETGCSGGKGGSQHLIDTDAGFMGSAPILASTISVGVGAAWAAKRRGEDRVVVIYFGDGATEEGAFHEAMNFASLKDLPVLFVCENNFYSVHTPAYLRQPEGRPIHKLVEAHGVPGVVCNGNDADEVWRMAGALLDEVRSGVGPALLECLTYRWKEHCGPNEDVSLGYRSQEELDYWKGKCPVVSYAERLKHEGVFSLGDFAEMEAEIIAEIDDAFDFARSSAFPPPEALMQFVHPNGMS